MTPDLSQLLAYPTPNIFLEYRQVNLAPTIFAEGLTDFTWTLPSGLSVNLANGAIVGSPQEIVDWTDYSVTATAFGHAVSAPVKIRTGLGYQVNDPGDQGGSCDTDTNVCTLRAALEESNAIGDSQTRLILVPAGTYPVTQATLSIATNVEILGDGQTTTIIDASGSPHGLFVVSKGPGLSTQKVIFSDLTMQNGSTSQSGGNLDIFSGSDVSLSRVTVTGGVSNLIDGGGGIATGGNLTLDFCTVSMNSHDGIVSTDASAVVVRDSLISGNNSGSSGGGIHCAGASLDVERSLIAGNQANNQGGGLFIGCGATITNTTISGNMTAQGGAAYVAVGSLDLLNDTIVDNNGGAGDTGGIDASPSTTVTLQSTILARNFAGTMGSNCNTALSSRGDNLTNGACSECALSSSTGDICGVDPGLAALADNGGPTQSYLPNAGGPAIDHAAGPLGGCPPVDQRGLPRPVGGGCDIGSVEVQ